MTIQNIAVFLIVASSSSFCLGKVAGGTGNGTDIQDFTSVKNCPEDVIYYSNAFLKFKCVFFSKTECYDNYNDCVSKLNYNPQETMDICQKELGSQFMMNAPFENCAAGPDKYLEALQTTCCLKTKLGEQVNKSASQVQDDSESCYDKINCPDNDICSGQPSDNPSSY